MILALLFTVALASGPPVDIDNPDDCIDAGGYLAGEGFPGGDCCSFVVCNAANLNKTGFIGKCMGATVWNDGIKACDDAKYVTTCDPSLCDVPSRTSALCSAPQPTGSTCCVGQNEEKMFPGYEPVYTAISANEYQREGEREVQKCPFGQEFIVADCCCEFVNAPVAPCDDTTSFYFENPADPCCSYLQCWANRTGVDIISCMPPSVWNEEAKACDIPQRVMACMGEDCGTEMTDFPCNGGTGDCCRAGVYFTAGTAANAYVITDYANPDLAAPDAREQCCPPDMDGNEQVFNNAEDVCCCEPPQP